MLLKNKQEKWVYLVIGVMLIFTALWLSSRKKERLNNMDNWLSSVSNFILPNAEASPAVADTAVKYLGKGEQGGNNMGEFIKSLGVEGQPWCSAFVSKVVTETGENPFGNLPMARQWLNKGRRAGMEVSEPQKGDLAIFSRGDPKGMSGHIGIVYSVDKNKIVMIEGNTGDYPSVVKKITYDRKNMGKLLGYIRTNEVGYKNMLHDEYVDRHKQSFGDAFSSARSKGLKTFEYEGKKYTTKVK